MSMRGSGFSAACCAALTLAIPTSASSETRDEYLSRLKDVCSVECLQPRDFLRKARKQANRGVAEMAVIMDVGFVRRENGKYQLISLDLRGSNLVDLNILDSAGINTSMSNGVGGLPRGQQGNNHPDAIVIEIDQQAFSDFMKPTAPAYFRKNADNGEAAIVVEGESERKFRKPTLADLNGNFMNRRIVVRGAPRLEAQWIGGRRDFRNRQVTLVVDNADDLVVLPRYDKDGRPVFDESQRGLQSFYRPDGN